MKWKLHIIEFIYNHHICKNWPMAIGNRQQTTSENVWNDYENNENNENPNSWIVRSMK